MQKIICLYGRPAAGKNTQAKKLAKEFNMKIFGMGDALRAEIESGSELGQQIKSYVDEGTLVPDELMEQIIKNIKSDESTTGIIFDGFPRMLSQALMLEKIIKESKFDFVGYFLIKVSTETALHRITERGKLTNRPDDVDQEAVKNRLDAFDEQSVHLIKHYADLNKLIEIDGEKSIEEVYKQITKNIN